MSIDTAIDIVTKSKQATPALVGMIQENFADSHHKHHKHQHHLRHGKQPDGGVAAAQAAGAYAGGAQKALDMLNQMMKEAMEKMDFEIVRCDSEERGNLAQLKGIREDVIMF